MSTERARFVGAVALVCAVVIGCGGDSGPTRESQCRQVLDVSCNRLANPCTVVPANQVDICISSGIVTCCNGMCGARAISTQAEIDSCLADIRAASCSSLDVTHGGTLPPSCIGVVRSALVSTQASALRARQESLPEAVGRLVSQ